MKDRNGKELTETVDIKKRWQGYTELYKKGPSDQSQTFWSVKSSGP